MGGRFGKVNWFRDKAEDVTALYKNMPPEMITPWKGEQAEIRVSDMAECKNVDDFKSYMQEFNGAGKRFLDPHWGANGPVRISFRTQDAIVRYLLNYIGRDKRYTQLDRNCQTFAADCEYIFHVFGGYLILIPLSPPLSLSRSDRHLSPNQFAVFNFICGKGGKAAVEPFHPINRMEYKNRSHTFLYDPDMYQ